MSPGSVTLKLILPAINSLGILELAYEVSGASMGGTDASEAAADVGVDGTGARPVRNTNSASKNPRVRNDMFVGVGCGVRFTASLQHRIPFDIPDGGVRSRSQMRQLEGEPPIPTSVTPQPSRAPTFEQRLVGLSKLLGPVL